MEDSFQGSIFVVVRFPDEWPPPSNVILLKSALDGGTIIVTAGAKGEFAAQAVSLSGETQAQEFQRVQVDPGATVLLGVVWNSESVSLRINGHELGADPNLALDPVIVSSKAEHRALPEVLRYPNLRPEHARRQVEVLFLETVKDIDSKVISRTRYGLIRAAGLLRQLLLDGLVHKVNRPYRQKLAFEVIEFRSKPPIDPVMHWRMLDPSRFPGVKVEMVGLDALLSIPVLEAGGVTVTVRDVIRACANAKGGIHYGPAANDRENLLLHWDERIQASPVEPSLDFLRGLCRICLSAFEPIIKAIESTG